MRPPSLLSLTLDSALLRIAHLHDLSRLPDHLLIDLFRIDEINETRLYMWYIVRAISGTYRIGKWEERTIAAGKLTEKVLKLFLATDCEEIALLVQLLNIKQPLGALRSSRSDTD
ncbi:uncharacterized protein LOC127770961 [Oryza glaberrima]|uniref:uncharacterized protein LOC127770961 n=1 Tax=Oryza glaberrima TaxID=4538 RepID=UPI00224C1A96|nr:uncharacterized protein LOC127770961 [Oryza glaberrima]